MNFYSEQAHRSGRGGYAGTFLARSIIALGILLLLLPATLRAQQTQGVTLRVENATIAETIAKLEKETEYRFNFSKSSVDTDRRITLDSVNEPIKQVLDKMFSGSGTDYTIQGHQIILNSAPPAQNAGYVELVVADGSGDPLPGVSVVVQGTRRGASSDINGRASIQAGSNDVLEVSYLGYSGQTINVGNRTTINVTLREEATEMDEVVVIGYGTVKKKDLTGAVSAISGTTVASRNNQMLSTALQGAMPGVTLTRTNGAPGAAGTINIRGVTTIGNSDPLIIIDGVPGGSLNDLNPNDVDNISVLKDAASASIYGSRAAAGVILVTTNRAKKDHISLDYLYEYGIEQPTGHPEYVDVIRFMEMTNELRWNDAGNDNNQYPTYSRQTVEDYWYLNEQNPDQYPNTDWRGLILNNSSPRQRHVFTISGGSDKVRSKATVGYDDVQGLHVNRSYNRLTTRLNNDITINKFISAAIDINYRRSLTINPVSSPINNMRLAPPVYPALWQDGRIAEGKSGDNPYAAMLYGGDQKVWNNRVSGKVALYITPLDGLRISAIVAPTYNFDKTKKFTKKIEYYAASSPTTLLGTISGHSATGLTENRNDSHWNNLQLYANYDKSFGDHSLSLMAGYEENYTIIENLSVTGDRFELSLYPYMDRSSKDALSVGGRAYESSLNSVFGRFIYSYRNRYLLQANVRYDGSSRFAEGQRWGVFPSASVGWVVSEEKFMKNVRPITFLKLRASYGTLGNERLSVVGGNSDILREYYPYIAALEFPTALFYNGDTIKPEMTAAQTQYAVTGITWETTESFDVGIDLGFFSDRLRFTVDYYYKLTKDMLLDVKIPAYVGFKDPVQNAAKMATEGYEIEIGWNDRIGKINYGISFNLSDSKTTMGYMAGTQFLGEQVKMMRSQYNEWYGYLSDGIYQSQAEIDNSAHLTTAKPGDIKYMDVSGPNGEPDGVISPEYDRVFLGGSLPRYEYGANLTLGWKGIDFQLTLQGIGKQWVRKTTNMVAPLRSDWGNIPAIIDGRYWSHYNTDEQNLAAEYPRLSRSNVNDNYAMSDYWLFNGAYMRVKNIVLGYTLPAAITQKASINRLRVYVSLNDFFCLSKFPKGWDPEMASNGYPIMKSVNFGVNVNF